MHPGSIRGDCESSTGFPNIACLISAILEFPDSRRMRLLALKIILRHVPNASLSNMFRIVTDPRSEIKDGRKMDCICR